MAGIRGKGGVPMNSEAWAEDHRNALAKASEMKANNRGTKADQDKADQAVLAASAGYDKAVADEAKKKKGDTANAPTGSLTAALFKGLLGQ